MTSITNSIAGLVGSFAASQSLPTGRQRAGSASDGRFVFVAGGTSGTPSGLAVVERGEVDAAGHVAAWISQPLPRPFAAGAIALVAPHFLVFTYGLTNGAYDQVDATAVAADGALGIFRPMPTLRAARYGHALVVVRGFVYAIGGRAPTDEAIDRVERSAIGADGSLGPWTETRPLPAPRAEHFSFALD